MSSLRLVGAIICVFLVNWASDFVIHSVILAPDYVASMSLWRPESDMMAHMAWLFGGQFLAAAMMTLVYVRGFASRRSLSEACLFGLLMGLFHQTFTLVLYTVQPLPGLLAVKWVLFGVAQAVLLSLVLYGVCRPRAVVASESP